MSTAASPHRSEAPGQRGIVLMGVAGCGKSAVGAALAEHIGATYLDGDDLHPRENIAKMSRGEPLTDEDRWPWLTLVGRKLAQPDGILIVGCSALKRRYREHIRRQAGAPVTFVHLAGAKRLIATRMAARSGHFMPATLLDSQFAALELPEADENPNLEAVEEALASPVRTEARAATEAVLAEFFSGRIHHHVTLANEYEL